MDSATPTPPPGLHEPRSSTARVFMTAIAAVTWFALVLQFYLMVLGPQSKDMDRIRLIANYFSLFTILTNLLVALGLTLSWVTPHSRWGRLSSRPVAMSGTAVYIGIVGIAYSFLLRHLWNPQGLQKLCDILLHDVVPFLYVAYWLLFVPKGALRWKDVLYWLPYPLIYFCYSLVRGAAVGWYPYPFIDASKLGYAHVLANGAALVCAFLALSLLVVAIGRWRGHNAPSDHQQWE